jgi:16S rRNA (cytosine967-C5)-methyltransferase
MKRLFCTWWLIQKGDLPEDLTPKTFNTNAVRTRFKKAQEISAVRESVPDWIYNLGREELGDRWDLELKLLNQQAQVVLRANTLLIQRDVLQLKLQQEEIETVPSLITPEALVLKERKNVFSTQAFKKGFFEVQDGSSQLVAHFMNLEPGLRVIDACAGAGGKSLHIAALLKNKGKIISMDVEERKLIELKKRAARAKVDVIETKLIESSKAIKRLEKTADRVLLDVPCTGLGVLKRNPDSKWKLSREKYLSLLSVQADILSHYSKMVKPGGLLIYSTCSLLPSENRDQIKKFLQIHTGWDFEEDKEVYPSQNGFDGFYMARLKRL